MEATAADATHGLKRGGHASLHAMMLGGQTLEQLAELVNWANAADFVPREVKPWAALEQVSSHQLPNRAASTLATIESDPQASEEPVTDIEIEEASIKTVTAIDSAPPDSAADSGKAIEPSDEQRESNPEVSEPSTITPISTEGTADDVVQVLVVREAAQASIDHSDTLKTSIEPSTSQSNGMATPSVSHDAPSEKAIVLPLNSESVFAPRQHTPRPIAIPTYSINRTSPRTAVMSQKAAQAPSSNIGDPTYLHRLESLVLELNLQLAQLNSPVENNADHSQWLSQRVIELSLQNMALQEQLAKHETNRT